MNEGALLEEIRAEAAEATKNAQVAGISFPAVIDSTIRSDFASCPKKFYEAHILNLRGMATNVHLHFGGVYAKGLEEFRRAYWSRNSDSSGDVGKSIACGVNAIIKAWGNYETPEGQSKTLEACLDAFLAYLETYPPAVDPVSPLILKNGEPAVEFTFAIPIPGCRHPETGQPILYAGRFDMLAVMRGQEHSVFIDDEKTTSQLGASWVAQWKLRGQMTGYVWAAKTFGYPVAGVIIRGSSILKNSIGQAMVIEQRYAHQVDRWLIQLSRDVDRMIQCWKDGYWDYNFDSACSSYGGCPYLNVCLAQDPNQWRSTFVVAPWDPLARGG